MRYGGFVLAYHGCDHEIAERVLSGKEELILSKNEFDWLGSGVYFWENSATRALHWARFLHDHPLPNLPRIEAPAAIGAVIAPGNCLDLSEAASLEILRAGYPDFVAVCKKADIELPKNERGFRGDQDLVKRNLDCAVINYLHTTRGSPDKPAFNTVRCPFFEGDELYPGSGIKTRTHLQWSVRDPKKSVIGYFRPREES
jgi:hypothetical protein